MKYQFTDFFYWEQIKIDQLRKEGKFVFSVIDTGGIHYAIRRKGFVNRYAFLVTDTDFLTDKNEITDVEFEKLGGEEVEDLDVTEKDLSKELAEAKAEYERSHEWK